MNEIYWITRFDSIHCLGIAMFWISLIIFVVFWLISITTDDITGENYFNGKQRRKLRRVANCSVITLIIGLTMWIFVPTQKEALLIYGVGGTIDYIKQNPTAKQLPDKCIKALDSWMDSWNEEEKKDSVKN
jgi:Na+-driven multidrug efflux pump